ncbi:MAG: 3-deoxy-D-manno-octulosonic acid transferase [Nitrospirae bacterium]|nr:3-deoxy-D-manno-octulosonic acid transferase [Nitrospirota bacterium]
MGVILLIYNLFSFIFLITLLPYLYLKRRNKKDGILWLKEKFGFIPEEKLKSIYGRPIWIHAVSVGEVMAALPLIKVIKEGYPDRSLVLSTITDTGNLIARERAKEVDAIIYLPFDISLAVKSALRRISPEIFILIETEIWPNLLRTLNREGIPSIIINGRISQQSLKGYKLVKPFMKAILKNINRFGMQTTSDAERIRAIGADPFKVEVIGNIKFDQSFSQDSVGSERLKRSYGIGERRLFVAGSTHEGEEEIISDAFIEIKKYFHDLILLIAPRHIERVRRIEGLLKVRGIAFRRRTELIENGLDDASVIILDTIGELAQIYSIATVVFIGGSLVPAGGHNVLEPAVYSKPIIFGLHMENFKDIAQTFLEKGAACQVSNGPQFKRELGYLLSNMDVARSIGENARKVIDENKGAVERSLMMIEKFLK